ncbi:Cysteine proteinase 1 [Apostasia shenzhenica]|uniref:Cysteine proteinase 1 n=1 Tax=Apostasia shenzhenica TaxID=1088818 RepID=A0A2I0B0H5_9ASPA|nr:Cysteine proteinase 1 [Apostasia shenzhenica]
MVDCDHMCDDSEPDACDSGCNGGLMNTAFEYLLKAGGLETEKDYPYTGYDRGSCKFQKEKIAASVPTSVLFLLMQIKFLPTL